jgi:hypothetical protein
VASFHKALNSHMQRCGDTPKPLIAAAILAGLKIHEQSILGWLRSKNAPRSHKSFAFLKWLEWRYGLPEDYFRTKLCGPPNGHLNVALRRRSGHARSQLRYHLPDDFEQRSPEDRQEVIRWIEQNILPCSTDYGKYLKKVCNEPFALRFPEIIAKGPRRREKSASTNHAPPVTIAPERLSRELAKLVKFKTAEFTEIGFQRTARWSPITTKTKVHQLGIVFGALVAPRESNISGFGVPAEHLSMGLLAFPALLDRYLEWCRKRRGFYTRFEQHLLSDIRSFTRPTTGWMLQNPELVQNLKPIPGIVSLSDIRAAQRNWSRACTLLHQYAKDRSKDLGQILRQHRDPFAPIMAVLSCESPLGEYRKIADEVLRRMPDEAQQPKAAAEGVRAYLLLRFGMHLGLRQRNLRELLFCYRDQVQRPETTLEALRCGELRCNSAGAWEVLIPSSAFKNARSSFFTGNPYRLVLPDLENLYSYIENYLDRHRPMLLDNARDPGTFFVKTVRPSTKSASFDMGHFYRTWRETIQRFGIYNPYTGKGVIKGLLPHGPHGVRDVLATHILKQTGSFELASYAIQDTPRMVVAHYGRFLPEDKTAQAAKILNKIWQSHSHDNETLVDFDSSKSVTHRRRPRLDC